MDLKELSKTSEGLKRGAAYLDYIHRVARSGIGLSGLKKIMPSADPVQLQYWLESNSYPVDGKAEEARTLADMLNASADQVDKL